MLCCTQHQHEMTVRARTVWTVVRYRKYQGWSTSVQESYERFTTLHFCTGQPHVCWSLCFIKSFCNVICSLQRRICCSGISQKTAHPKTLNREHSHSNHRGDSKEAEGGRMTKTEKGKLRRRDRKVGGIRGKHVQKVAVVSKKDRNV